MKLIKELVPYAVIIITVILIRTFVITPVQVDGESMYPTLLNNELLILKKYDHSYDRFDIIVFKYNGDELVKRVIGLPGEYVEYKNNKLYINGSIVEDVELPTETADFSLSDLGYKVIPAGYYFVLGDNRTNSLDSRFIGLISEDQINGVTNFALFPFKKFGTIKTS